MNAIGTEIRSRTFRISSSAPATVMPCSSARWLARCTVGPSAIGSEKGIEISNPSAPAATIRSRIATVVASSRWPAMTHGSRARRPSARRFANRSAKEVGLTALGKAGRLLRPRQHGLGDRAGAVGALLHDGVEPGLIRHQLLVLLAHRRQLLDHQLPQAALEVAISISLVACLDRARLLAAQQAVDGEQVEDAGPARVEADLAQRVGHRACDLPADQIGFVVQRDAAPGRLVALAHLLGRVV